MRRAIFTIVPWESVEGDPASPRGVAGVRVADVVLRRTDSAGALSSLADGRYAITGQLVAVGSARQLKRYVRRRLRRDAAEAELGWYREVIAELARRSPRPFRVLELARRDRARARLARTDKKPRGPAGK